MLPCTNSACREIRICLYSCNNILIPHVEIFWEGHEQDEKSDRGDLGWEVGRGEQIMKMLVGTLSGGTIKMTFWHEFGSRQGDCQGTGCCHGS